MGEYLLIGLTSIVAFGILAQWLAWRLRLPAILLLLVFGIIAGPITHFLNPDQIFGEALTPIVSLSVAIILFEGGLSLRISDLKEIGATLGKLISIGIVITWLLATLAAYLLLDIGWSLSILFGAILIVTGPTVIIPLLRHVRPTGKVGSVLKWEGIINDPIGAMMSVLVFEIILAGGIHAHGSTVFLSLGKTVIFGTLLGIAGAAVIYYMLKRHLMPDYLQNPVALMFVLVVFAASNVIQHESGLWAVTVMGIALANQKRVKVRHIIEFKENLRVLLISVLFIMLASRLEISHLNYFNWESLAFLGVLILLIRPASVFLSTFGCEINNKERLFISWMAPRGIVAAAISSIFAIELAEAGYQKAEMLVPYTFVVIIGTVTIYGLTANKLAIKLNLAKPVPRGVLILGAHKFSRMLADTLEKEGIKVLLADSNKSHLIKAQQKGLRTYYGNILAIYALDEINLDGIGHLMAMTPNDEVNSLATIRFADYFGSSEVFQLAPYTKTKNKENEPELPEFLNGRILFKNNLDFYKLSEYINGGAELHIEKLTEEYTFEDFNQKWSERIIPLFLIKPEAEIKIFSADEIPPQSPGDKIVGLKLPEDIEFNEKEHDTT